MGQILFFFIDQTEHPKSDIKSRETADPYFSQIIYRFVKRFLENITTTSQQLSILSPIEICLVSTTGSKRSSLNVRSTKTPANNLCIATLSLKSKMTSYVAVWIVATKKSRLGTPSIPPWTLALPNVWSDRLSKTARIRVG